MHMIDLRIVLLLIYMVVLINGCGKKDIERPAPEISEPFKISIVESGGFTGASEGYTISSDGTVEKFRQMPGQEKNVLLSTKMKENKVDDYRKWFEKSGLMQTELNEKGNMTTTVRYENPDTTYVWSYPTGSLSASPMVKKISAWCAEVKSAIESQK